MQMYKYDFNISDLVFRIESEREMEFRDYMLPFLDKTVSVRTPHLIISVEFGIEPEYTDEDNIAIQRFYVDKERYICRIEDVDRKNYYRLIVPMSFADTFCDKVNLLLYLAMERLLQPFDRVMLHASAVIHEGKAYIFTAPSGGGKSTHAALWEKYYGAEVLNGDKVIIKIDSSGCVAYGGPVAGSSDIYINKGAPIEAIVLIEKGTENVVSEAKKRKGYLSLYSEMIKSTWDENFNKRLLELAEEIIKTVPVLTLKCRPEQEAVECVKNHLERVNL